MSTPYPWRLMVAVAAIVFAVTVGAGLLIGRPAGLPSVPPVVASSAPPDAGLPTPDERQATILLQVRGVDRRVASSMLLGFGGTTGHVTALVIPPTLLLPTYPSLLLADVDGPTGPVGAREPLSTLLGVRIDETVELDRLAWSGLIDAIGPESMRDMSAQDVAGALTPVLSRLPASRQAIGQLLTSLGSMARTTLPNETTGRLLVALGDRVRQQGLVIRSLPVSVVKAGLPTAAVVDPFHAAFVVGSEFPEAQLLPDHPGALRVIVERGASTLGTYVAVQRRLSAAGFGVVEGQVPAEPFATTTSIVVAGTGPAALARGRAVAAALDAPESAVAVDSSAGATVDVRVTLGRDVGQSWG